MKSETVSKRVTFFTHPPSLITLLTVAFLTFFAYLFQPTPYFFLLGGFSAAILLSVYLFWFEARNTARHLQKLSVLDESTGLYNRRGFLILAEQHRKVAMRKKTGFYVTMVDIDPLEKINNAHGQAEGDRAIHLVADVLRKTFRMADILSRLENSTFALIAIDASLDSKTIMEKRLLSKLAECVTEKGLPYTISLALGSAFFNPTDDCPSVEELMVRADKKLYDEKEKNKRRGS